MFEKYLINDICDVGSSKRIYLSEYQESGIPFYRGKEIIEKDSNKEISNELFISHERYNEIKKKYGVPQKGDILMTAVGTIGVSWYVDESDFYFKDGNLIWFKNFRKDKVNSKYLYYVFKSKLFSEIIKNISIGSTQKAITIEQVKKIELEFPIIELQNKIVKVLDNINNKIRVNNEINNNLHNSCIEIFNETFNEFECEEALENVCDEITRGYTKGYVDKSNLINLNQKVNKGEVLEKQYCKYLDENQEIPSNRFAKENDILLNSLGQGTLGRVHLFGESVNNIVVDQHITILRTGDKINPYYLYYLLISPEYQNKIEGSVTGTTGMLMLNISAVRSMKIPIPNQDDLKKFKEIATPIRRMITQNYLENERLLNLKDALLPRLINGEIDLDNIEI